MSERFDRYLERCLYDPEHGFYTTGAGSAGRRRGDFLTSPEVGPLFAETLARAIDGWWAALGRPEELVVYDAGTGPGTLARALAAAPGASAGARQVRGFDRAEGLPDDLSGAVVIANELLDNLPFRIVEAGPGGWQEVYVVDDGSGPAPSLVPLDSATSARLTARHPTAEAGDRVPLLEGAARWVTDVLARTPAVLVAFDYGAETTAELVARGGWLRTYRRHERGHDPFHQPGRWDITTDIAVDQLPPPAAVTDQASFLRRYGIEELVAEGRARWLAAAAAPDVAALRMRSRVAEAEALVDPDGLGSWLVCVWGEVADPAR